VKAIEDVEIGSDGRSEDEWSRDLEKPHGVAVVTIRSDGPLGSCDNAEAMNSQSRLPGRYLCPRSLQKRHMCPNVHPLPKDLMHHEQYCNSCKA